MRLDEGKFVPLRSRANARQEHRVACPQENVNYGYTSVSACTKCIHHRGVVFGGVKCAKMVRR